VTILSRFSHVITVFTDHANLQYWRQPIRLAAESLEKSRIAEYNVSYIISPEKQTAEQTPYLDTLTIIREKDNENVTVLQPHVHRTVTIETLQQEQGMSLIRNGQMPIVLRSSMKVV